MRKILARLFGRAQDQAGPARGVGDFTEEEERQLSAMVSTFARSRRPVIIRRFPGRPELGGQSFMIVHIAGDHLCSKLEQAVRRLTRKGARIK